MQDNAAAQDFALPAVGSPPLSVQLDPDNWVLETQTTMALPDADADGVPDTADNCPAASNAAQADLDRDGVGDACDADRDGDGVANSADCAPSEPAVAALPGDGTGLLVTGGALADLSWDADPLESLQVTYDVLRGTLAELAAAGGVGKASCLDVGLPAARESDAWIPAAGSGVYYLVRKRNLCGAGPLGAASSGQPRQSALCP